MNLTTRDLVEQVDRTVPAMSVDGVTRGKVGLYQTVMPREARNPTIMERVTRIRTRCFMVGRRDRNRSVLIVAVGLVQPIGVSTQYVVLDGVLLHNVLPDVASRSPYLAKTAQEWTLATIRVSSFVGDPARGIDGSDGHRRFTQKVPFEYGQDGVARILESVGLVLRRGFLLLFGSPLGGGCTSGP